jgi:hypothetical protein
MLAKFDGHHERMMARMDSQLEKMEDCLGNKKATDLESNPEEVQYKAVNEEVPKEEATVETLQALKKQYRDQHLAIRHHNQLKKQFQGHGGSQKKLAAV